MTYTENRILESDLAERKQQIRRQREHKMVNQFNQKSVMTPIKHTKRDIVEAVVLTLIVGVILVVSFLIGE